MENNQDVNGQEQAGGNRLLWFIGGCALSVTTLCSVVLLLLLFVSTGVNAYLAWTMSGYEVDIIRPDAAPTVVIVATPTTGLVMLPTQTPTPAPTSTPPLPTQPAVEAEYATLAAIATQAAEKAATNAPTVAEMADPTQAAQATGASSPSVADLNPDAAGSQAATPDATAELATSSGAPAVSTNVYALIPIDGEREKRPAEESGDLNLKLREPQLADFEASLVDIPNAGSDSSAPNFGVVFNPDFTATYVVHDWDWGCNCPGKLLDDGKSVLVGIRTTPGQPVFIPYKEEDIFGGKYVAQVLYASEDSLTFVYSRSGNVVKGYTVHYLGLQTDPNLLKLFQESQGNELPGLTLDTPVGVASDELIVAIRDNGTFLDARSRGDWWR